MRPAGIIIVFLIVAAFLTCCSSQACYDEVDALANTALYASGTGVSRSSDSLTVTGITPDTTITFIKTGSVAYFSFPLNPAAEEMTLYIRLNRVTDTVDISYSNYLHLVSPGCGYTFYSTIISLSTTHNIIDTLIIDNKRVTLDGENNLRLFY